MNKNLLLLIFSLLLSSCGNVHTVTTETPDNIWANEHPVIIDSTDLFEYVIYLPPVIEGESFDVKVKLINISDTIQMVKPEIFYITYYDYDKSTIVINHGENPVLEKFNSEESSITVNDTFSRTDNDANGDLIRSNSLLAELVNEEKGKLGQGIPKQIYTWKSNYAPPKRSSLVTQLQRIEKYWLQPASLFPEEYAEGTIKFHLPSSYLNLKIYFNDGKDLIQIPVRIIKKTRYYLKNTQ